MAKLIFATLAPAYYTILNGQIRINPAEDPLPIYDGQVPPNYNGSYILLGERISSQTPGKTCTNYEAFFLVDICIKGASYGFKDSQNCANQVLALINSSSNPNCAPDFQVVSTSIASTNELAGINASDNVFRCLLRFRHLVTEL